MREPEASRAWIFWPGFCGGRGAQERAIFRVDEGIATVEDGEWRKSFEARGSVGEARGAGGDDDRGSTAKSFPGTIKAALGCGEPHTWGLALQTGGERSEAVGWGSEAALGGGFEAVVEVIEVLFATVEGVAESREDGVGGERCIALASVDDLEADSACQANGEGVYSVFDAVLCGGDQLGGGRWGRSPEVGDEVRDGEVGLMPNRRDDRQGRRDDSAGEGLVVEAGEVFDGSAAASEDDEIDQFGMGVEVANAAGDGAGAVCALHQGREDEDVQAGVATSNYVHDVADNCPGGRG